MPCAAGDTHYTTIAGRDALRERIARQHSRQSGQAVDAENVIVVSGAQNGLFCASLCLCGPGDEVLVPEPLYLTYEATIRASGATLVPVPVLDDGSFRHRPRRAARSHHAAHTRAIFFATPCNPTGVVMRRRRTAAHRRTGVAARPVGGRRRGLGALTGFETAHISIASLPGMAERTRHRQQPVQVACDGRLAHRLGGRAGRAGRATWATCCCACCTARRAPTRRRPAWRWTGTTRSTADIRAPTGAGATWSTACSPPCRACAARSPRPACSCCSTCAAPACPRTTSPGACCATAACRCSMRRPSGRRQAGHVRLGLVVDDERLREACRRIVAYVGTLAQPAGTGPG